MYDSVHKCGEMAADATLSPDIGWTSMYSLRTANKHCSCYQSPTTTDLWCQVLWGAAECAGAGPKEHLFLAQPKVSYLDVAVFVQQ